jgi:hypothetical protein
MKGRTSTGAQERRHVHFRSVEYRSPTLLAFAIGYRAISAQARKSRGQKGKIQTLGASASR